MNYGTLFVIYTSNVYKLYAYRFNVDKINSNHLDTHIYVSDFHIHTYACIQVVRGIHIGIHTK